MGETDYNALLYDKMKAEQDKYRDWLLNQPPEEILNHTYEYTMREDIVMCMEEMELSPKQAKWSIWIPFVITSKRGQMMCSNETKTEKAGEKMVCKLKTIRADMLVLQCQLERELIRYVKRYLCQPQVTIITNDKQFAFMCELYDYVENTELPPEMVSSLMKTKNVLELSWDEWLMNAEVEDMEDSIEKVAELLRKGKI